MLAGLILVVGGTAAALGFETNWQPVELAALSAIALVAYGAEVRIKDRKVAVVDASIACALVALWLCGPLPAFLVWVAPDLASRWFVREAPRFSPGAVATQSSLALAALAGAAVLAALASVPPALALFAAGLVLWVVNFAIARVALVQLRDDDWELRTLVSEEFTALAPGFLAMLAVGTAAALLFPEIGVFSFALLAAAVVVPEVAVRLGADDLLGRAWAFLTTPAPGPVPANRFLERDSDGVDASATALVSALFRQLQLARKATGDTRAPLAAAEISDLSQALVSLRRIANEPNQADYVIDGAKAMVEILEGEVGARHLQAVPSSPPSASGSPSRTPRIEPGLH